MKIYDILKKENIGKVYKITNADLEGETVTINKFLEVETEMSGVVEGIEEILSLKCILEMEFEENKLYKEIRGGEALKILANGGVVYGDEELKFAYYIKGNKLVCKDKEKGILNGNLLINKMLMFKWYIKR